MMNNTNNTTRMKNVIEESKEKINSMSIHRNHFRLSCWLQILISMPDVCFCVPKSLNYLPDMRHLPLNRKSTRVYKGDYNNSNHGNQIFFKSRLIPITPVTAP
ncbi:hypothetical protein Droror1_Dr00021094 [Drosera rotundifolia]